MSIIDDLLILVEDAKSVTLDEICLKMKEYKRQTIASSLGRLNSKGWLRKKKEHSQYHFCITEKGHQIIDRELSNIKYIDQKNFSKNWQIIIFNIPEKLRKYRDELRRQLVAHGFSRLHDSIWFSKQNQKNNLKHIIESLRLKQNVIFITTSDLNKEEEKNLIQKLKWNWVNIEKNYSKFITRTKKFLSMTTKESFRAKQIVYELAKIIKSDPKLPNHLDKNSSKKNEAIIIYKKIRPYCY